MINSEIITLVLGNAAVIIPLFLWNRSESRADIRLMDAKLESNRSLSLTIHQDTKDMIAAIHQEMKDFHGRLCALQERSK